MRNIFVKYFKFIMLSTYSRTLETITPLIRKTLLTGLSMLICTKLIFYFYGNGSTNGSNSYNYYKYLYTIDLIS
jgi:hypothetical protein